LKRANGLGLLVRGYRQALGLSQAELARRLGVERVSISLIENGRKRPSTTLLHNIADLLDIKTESLFLLSRPEAKLHAGARLGSRTSVNKETWLAFTHDKDLLAHYNVRPNELRMLSEVRIFGGVQHPRDFIFILSVIRQTLKS
jgi:putative transcriptional regulator